MLLDTNILLEWLLGRDKAEECRTLLERVQDGLVEASATDLALQTVAGILEREGRTAELSDLFSALSSFEGLTVLHASLEEQAAIARLATYFRLDFGDAYHAYFARQHAPLISYDRHFDGIVERKTPREVLG